MTRRLTANETAAWIEQEIADAQRNDDERSVRTYTEQLAKVKASPAYRTYEQQAEETGYNEGQADAAERDVAVTSAEQWELAAEHVDSRWGRYQLGAHHEGTLAEAYRAGYQRGIRR